MKPPTNPITARPDLRYISMDKLLDYAHFLLSNRGARLTIPEVNELYGITRELAHRDTMALDDIRELKAGPKARHEAKPKRRESETRRSPPVR